MPFFKTYALAISFILLSACGGGGGGSGPAPTPDSATSSSSSSSSSGGASLAEGLWLGTTNTNRAITGLVLDDGTFYVLYSTVGNPAVIARVLQGIGTAQNGSFSAADVRDFNIEGQQVRTATLSGSYNHRATLNGSVTYMVGSPLTFTTTYSTDYEGVATVSEVAGTYAGQVATSAGAESASFAVSAAGVISGSGASGCSVSGTLAPRASGRAYNVMVSFGGAPCLFANQTLSGHGYFEASTKRLYAVTPNAGRTDGALFVGVKP